MCVCVFVCVCVTLTHTHTHTRAHTHTQYVYKGLPVAEEKSEYRSAALRAQMLIVVVHVRLLSQACFSLGHALVL